MAALERQVSRLLRRRQRLQGQSVAMSAWRVMSFLAGFVAVSIGFGYSSAAGLFVTVIAVIVFAALVREHRRLEASIARHGAWLTIRQNHLARMRLDWAHIPDSTATAPPDHPFATDLDIVGTASLHRLMDTAVSHGGSTRLLDWLLATRPDMTTITRRAQLVAELRPLMTFRDKLTRSAMLAGHRGKWDGRWLMAWLHGETRTRIPAAVVVGMSALAFTNIALVFAHSADILLGAWRFSLVAYILLSIFFLRKMGDAFGEALMLKNEVDKLTAVLGFLENYHYDSHPALKQLCAPFTDTAQRPTAHFARLNLILGAHSLKGNAVFWMFVNLIVPWDIYFTAQLDRSKGQLNQLLPVWLDAWYKLEALNALATFAWLNPDYRFPTLTPDIRRLIAKDLGHPLIPYDLRVCNDFTLDGPGEVIIVTGSNMSGKSSFLRTIGINMVLAYAGCVIVAGDLALGLFRPYTCIKVSDSVVDGISYFYAEVKRLKALLAALNVDDAQEPLLFLIDEIFRGTNNRERLIGSRSYIRALVGGNGCGLISTHDLELVHLADDLPQVSNMHFREQVIDGRMTFDYRLRPGPSPTTNALRIMALEGLPVDAETAFTES